MNSFFLGFIIASLIFLISQATQAFAQAPPEVVINEFAIEPEQTVELLNTSNEIIDISGWHIDDNGGTTFVTIPPDTFMYPQACIVIQKNFNLNKSSIDAIRLFDNSALPTDQKAMLIDFYEYNASPGNGYSFERNPDSTESWITNPSSFEFFNESGTSCLTTPTQTPTPLLLPTNTPIITQSTTPSPTQITTPQSYDNIFISEVLVAPNAGMKEWIELYNDNDFEVNLSYWYIDDAEQSGSLAKQFSTTIAAKKYAVIELSSALFNNSGDSVRLLDFEEREKDSFTYDHSEKGRSWGWSELKSATFCLQLPSQNKENTECIPEETEIPFESSDSFEDKKDSINKEGSSNSMQTSNTSIQNTIYKTYSVSVSPPIIPHQGEKIDHHVLGASSAIDLPHQNTVDFSVLAMGYSLLSIGSLILKMIYSN